MQFKGFSGIRRKRSNGSRAPVRAGRRRPWCRHLLIHFEEFAGVYEGSARNPLAGKPSTNRKFGEWLSLVEHLVRDQGVGGSNPLSPTILYPRNTQVAQALFAFAA
jgi:hypothetical protein